MSRISFSGLPPGHHDVLKLALEAAHLPTDDLAEPDRLFFQLADEAGPIGFIGLEGEGPDRLLRSLVVLPGRKRKGYGGLLVAHAETHARQHGVARLHLLTTSVADFFGNRGYYPAKREAAPPAIAQSAQFRTLCPASAVYLVKELA